MKRLTTAHKYGKKLYTSYSAEREATKYTIYYKSSEEKFYLIIGDIDDPTQEYETAAGDFIDLLDGFDYLIEAIRGFNPQGFSENKKEYNESVEWLIEEDAKLKAKREVTPTSEDANQEDVDQEDIDQKDTKNDEEMSENVKDTSKGKKPEYKIIEFYISSKEEDWMEDQIAVQVRNDIIKWYSFTPLTKQEFWTYSGVQPTEEELADETNINTSKPAAAIHSRLRKVLAYAIDGVINKATQSGVISDLADYIGYTVSLYMTNETENEYGTSCAGFIFNYNGKFIAFGNKFDKELQAIISSQRLFYHFQPFIDELDDMIQRFNITSINIFSDFKAAENFILGQNSNIQKKISINENIAGPDELYGQAKERAEQEKQKAEKERKERKNLKYWKVRIHYNYKDTKVVDGLKAWLYSIESTIRPYNPNMRID